MIFSNATVITSTTVGIIKGSGWRQSEFILGRQHTIEEQNQKVVRHQYLTQALQKLYDYKNNSRPENQSNPRSNYTFQDTSTMTAI